MPVSIYPNVACLDVIGLMRTKLAGCSVHLYKSPFTPGAGTVLADLTAIEADFGGYAAITVTALLAAFIDPIGGASAQIGTVQFNADGTTPDNIIYGAWVQATGTPPVLYLAVQFDNPVPMSAVGDALPLDFKFNFGANQ